MATRLRAPSTPPQLLLRTRLLDALDRGAHERVTLLSAPAGTGKTVLLASWVKTRRLPGAACWLSLAPDHDDASRLLADLLSALRAGAVVAPARILDGLSAPPDTRVEESLPLLVNGLAELTAPLVLVLDDLHALSSPAASAAIEFLVRHAPEQCRLVLASRADPPLPIERLRVEGRLLELRARELAFDREETGTLCRRFGLALRASDVDALWARTEGWAAALSLAALSLKRHPEPARFIAQFAGTDRAVADYLLAEVLAGVSPEQREFMLRTCLVEELGGELADALTEREDGSGAATLAALEHAGALLGRVDEHGELYRYHPLFAEHLRAHLRHRHPDQAPLLHRRAARWYVGALHRARLAGRLHDSERLAAALTRLASAPESDAALASVLRSLALSSVGTARLWSGHPHGGAHALEQALALARADGHEQIELNCLAQLAIVALIDGHPARAAELSGRAIALAEREDRRSGAAAACAYLAGAAAAYQRGELTAAERLAAAAMGAAPGAQNVVRIAIAIVQALAQSALDPAAAPDAALKLRAARSAIEDCEDVPGFLEVTLASAEARILLAAGERARAGALLAEAHARMHECAELDVQDAALALEDGELPRARELLTHALHSAAHPATRQEAWLLQALVAQAATDAPGASQALEQALELGEREPLRDAFLAHGPAVGELLERQAHSGTAHPALLEVLLDSLRAGREGLDNGHRRAAGVPAQPLTERELRILRYLPTMLSNAEIGAEVFVSLNTVKTHLRSIYRKLGVRGRAEAVQAARELGLLPSGIARPRVLARAPHAGKDSTLTPRSATAGNN